MTCRAMKRRSIIVTILLFLLIFGMLPVFLAADEPYKDSSAEGEQETTITLWTKDSGYVENPTEEPDEESSDTGEIIFPETISLGAEVEEAIIGNYQISRLLVYGIIPAFCSLAIGYLFYKYIYGTFCR